MDWYDITGKYHERTFSSDCELQSLPEEWQRELAAIWRLEADVNNGAYLQFFSNWGRESYVYASRALHKMGAKKMAKIVDTCQALIDEHSESEDASHEARRDLIPNKIMEFDGEVVKEEGSTLPDSVVERINDLSYEFMDYPDNLEELGLAHYRKEIEGDAESK